MPESEGAVPSGHCLPGPGDSMLSPGNGAELGKCAGVRPGWAVHPAAGGASGGGEGAEGWCQGQSLSATERGFGSPYVCSALTLVVLLSMLAFSSSCQGHSLTGSGGKSIFCVEVY